MCCVLCAVLMLMLISMSQFLGSMQTIDFVESVLLESLLFVMSCLITG